MVIHWFVMLCCHLWWLVTRVGVWYGRLVIVALDVVNVLVGFADLWVGLLLVAFLFVSLGCLICLFWNCGCGLWVCVPWVLVGAGFDC